jgi:hypothetical protein
MENGADHQPPPAVTNQYPRWPELGDNLFLRAAPVSASPSCRRIRRTLVLADRFEGSSDKAEAGRRGGLSCASHRGPLQAITF